MNPNSFPFPYSTFSAPPMYYFLQVPPTILHSHCSTHQVGMPIHCCSHLMELQRQHLQLFWHYQMLQLNHPAVYKQHQLPLARIKRIMKINKNVKMISADAPVLFSKACELFILELTIRTWLHTEERSRHNILKSDLANAVAHANQLNFLSNIVTSDDE